MDLTQAVFSIKSDFFSPLHTFECGQCFRWEPSTDATSYIGIAGKHPAKIIQIDDIVYLFSNYTNSEFWFNYFDIDRNYEPIRKAFTQNDFTIKAAEFSRGMRILRQDPWEALCSFIISQCNNIPRIKSIIKKMCEMFGSKISFMDNEFYSFPNPHALANLSENDLAPLRSGYRAAYIINAARAVSLEQVDFHALASMNLCDAEREIMKLPGVGKKVANCFLLFGLGKTDAFPVDTWIKKAAKYFDGNLNPALFGEYAGIAQQYIFYYTRSLEN